MFSSQVTTLQRSERLVDSEENLQNRYSAHFLMRRDISCAHMRQITFSWDSLLVRVLDLWSKGCEFESQQEQLGNFLFFSRVNFVCWLYAVSVPPPCYRIIITIINPLTARVVGVPQMILQPLFSISPCSPLPSTTFQTPGLSIPWCCFPTSSSVSLVFFPLSLCLARWFRSDLMNVRVLHEPPNYGWNSWCQHGNTGPISS